MSWYPRESLLNYRTGSGSDLAVSEDSIKQRCCVFLDPVLDRVMRHPSHVRFARSCLMIIVALLLPHSAMATSLKSPADITGYYYFVEKTPKGFEDVDWISLAAVDAKGRKAPLNGFLRLKSRFRGKLVNFALVSPVLHNSTLTFSTKVVRGVSYQFKGQFLKLEDFENNEIVIKGHLIKFRNDRAIAQCDASYFYFTGD